MLKQKRPAYIARVLELTKETFKPDAQVQGMQCNIPGGSATAEVPSDNFWTLSFGKMNLREFCFN